MKSRSSTYTTAITTMNAIATYGVSYFGCTLPTVRKNKPSSAIAKNTRGLERMLPLSVPNTDSITSAPISETPARPSTTVAASVATDFDAASSGTDSARTYAALISRYTTSTTSTPPISANGRLRCGFFTSPDSAVRFCQPSYAHNAAINPMPMPDHLAMPIGSALSGLAAPPGARKKIAADNPTIASTLAPAEMFWMAAPSFTERTLAIATSTISTAATTCCTGTGIGTKKPRYSANIKLCAAHEIGVVNSHIQPNRKASGRP